MNVQSNNFYSADRFHATLVLSDLPPERNLTWWGNVVEAPADLQFGWEDPVSKSVAWTSVLQGRIDTITSIDLDAGLMMIEGRDYTADLIETKTVEAFVNRTSSEIATELAGRHGLTADVVATTTPVGQYYQLEHDRVELDEISRTTTEWDLLVYLAKHEQYDVWVSGRTLHFRPKVKQDDADPFVVEWSSNPNASNTMRLQLCRALTIAKGVKVTVKSWNPKTKQSFTKTVQSQGTKLATNVEPQQYVLTVPGKTEEEALRMANAHLAEISKHERRVTAVMPGNAELTPRDIVEVRGTGTTWDQRYFIDEIDRDISFDGGFVMTIKMKNTSVGSETTVL